MKALILAAGYGTRLRPHTDSLPKPLFQIAGKPVLDHLVSQLVTAGCHAIMINTHYLHDQIEAHVARSDYPVPVACRHEPQILGTGGAIKNVADFWDDAPFLVVNADVVSDIDLETVYQYHLQKGGMATLVLHDEPRFNQVWTDQDSGIRQIHGDAAPKDGDCCKLAFTGIQVLSPEIINHIPGSAFCSIITIYQALIKAGFRLNGFVLKAPFWHDIGTPSGFRQANIAFMLPSITGQDKHQSAAFNCQMLAGDGSDRKWLRIKTDGQPLIVADHGIQIGQPLNSEMRAFLKIGQHLWDRAIAVPQILSHDPFSGLVFLEDLGDTHLQTAIYGKTNSRAEDYYGSVIKLWAQMAFEGAKGFNPNWTWQTPNYDHGLILEKECRYFLEAFCNRLMGLNLPYSDYLDEFELVAERALENGLEGFIHRDFQSRNIMLKNNHPFLIDFQGGRVGPVQYDLASLLIDPYVNLGDPLKARLLQSAIQSVKHYRAVDTVQFRRGFTYLAFCRNLQILGAFAFLSSEKKKTRFAEFIPSALTQLRHRLAFVERREFPKLATLVDRLCTTYRS